jgi:hypothetical protein
MDTFAFLVEVKSFELSSIPKENSFDDNFRLISSVDIRAKGIFHTRDYTKMTNI